MAPWYQNAYEIVSVAYVFILRKESAKVQIKLKMKEWKNEKMKKTSYNKLKRKKNNTFTYITT